MPFKLPFTTAPVDKIETVGNQRTGMIEIRSIAGLSKVEEDFARKHQKQLIKTLVEESDRVHKKLGKRFTFQQVFNSFRASLIGEPPAVPSLSEEISEFGRLYEKMSEHNQSVKCVAVLRNRVPGCAEMAIEDFNDDEVMPPGIRREIIKFVGKEETGWAEVDEADKASSIPEAPTEEEAAK